MYLIGDVNFRNFTCRQYQCRVVKQVPEHGACDTSPFVERRCSGGCSWTQKGIKTIVQPEPMEHCFGPSPRCVQGEELVQCRAWYGSKISALYRFDLGLFAFRDEILDKLPCVSIFTWKLNQELTLQPSNEYIR